MKIHFLILKQLDRQLKGWRSLIGAKPKSGWVKTIRKALGMTADQLAARLNVKRVRIFQLEHAEVEGAVTLHTLKAAAAAMECELVYAIVPRISLEKILQQKAYELATERMKHVAHSMALEDQAVGKEQLEEQTEDLARELLLKSLKQLWNQ